MSTEPLYLLPFAPLLSFEAFLYVSIFISLTAIFFGNGGVAWAKARVKSTSSIPGPVGSPITGLISVFTGPTPHRVLAKLARAFNAMPLMSFSVGFTRFIISSEPETAKEVLNSTSFADRPVKESAYGLLFHRAIGFAPYGEYWRNLRRISATHLFSPRRISGFENVRREIGDQLSDEIKSTMKAEGKIEIQSALRFASLANIMMTVFGKKYNFFGLENDEVVELDGLVKEGYELLGVFNWSDHLPFLGWLDLQGVRRRCKVLCEKVNVFVGRVIDEHRAKMSNLDGGAAADEDKDNAGDFVDVLLALQKEEKIGDTDMIAVLWEMVFRGTDTVAILLTWILARMILHPDIQEKVQSEIDSVTSKPVADSDIPHLPYLQAVVKETLRLHPPGPLLSWARLAINDVHVGSNFIPAGTTAMVNMWAITHDEQIWSDAEKFKPERFIDEDVNIMGSDLRLAPFGAGRRVCPGKHLGLVTVHLWLAQMLQNFKWVGGEDGVDLTEVLKLSMEMKNPLVCKAIPRSRLAVVG